MSGNKKQLLYSATRFQFVKVRLAYANTLIVPKPFRPGQPEKFGCTILMPPGHEGVDLTQAAIEAAVEEEYGPKAKWPKRLKGLTHDPVLKSVADFPKIGVPGDWCFVRASSLDAPGIVDPKARVIGKQDLRQECYSGRWANVSVNAYCYTVDKMTQGVTLGLHNVQLLQHDKRLGADRPTAEDEFDPTELPEANNNNNNNDNDDDDDLAPPPRRRR